MNINQLIENKQYDLAIKECKSLIADAELDDDFQAKLTGLVYLGIIYTKQEKYWKSKEIFDYNFDDIVAECRFYWLGQELIDTYIYFNEKDKAEQYVNAFLSENRNNTKAYLSKGMLLYDKEKYDEAEKVLTVAQTIQANNKQILYTQGLIQTKLNNKQRAIKLFEQSFDLGYEASIVEIIKLLFERTGKCDFENCKDTCCKGVILKGTNGKTINKEISFNQLINNDSRNSCWIKSKETTKGNWIFECKKLGENNFCNDYANRPENCRSYPSSILNTRKSCSYRFELNKENIKFCSKNTLNVVLHILKTYGFHSEMNLLATINKQLLQA